MSAGINRDEWLKALADLGHSTEDDQSAVSIMEAATMFRMDRSTASRYLKRLVERGKATQTHKFTTGTDGRRVYAIAYRLKKK